MTSAAQTGTARTAPGDAVQQVRAAIAALDPASLRAQLDATGVALTPPLLTAAHCAEVSSWYDHDTLPDTSGGTAPGGRALFRGTVEMSRHAFGAGEYRYFADPLPAVVRELRLGLYPPLARIANDWAEQLGIDLFPLRHNGLLERCASAGQHRPTPLLLRYGPGGYNCLHQDVYGAVTFPLQVAILLSTPEVDFTGGESVFVEQRPRQQSRPVVVRPRLGQGVVFPVRERPVPGARGVKRVVMRHGVSTVHSGQRFVLGIIFHNAA